MSTPTTRCIAEFPWNNSDMHDGERFIGKPNEKEWQSTGAVFGVECSVRMNMQIM